MVSVPVLLILKIINILIVPNLTLITPDNTTTLQDYVDNYPSSSIGSNHWIGSCSINKVVDENTKVMGTDNLVSAFWLH